MRPYLSFFKIRFVNGLQYRAAALAGLSTQFAWGFMNILLFRAFYQSGANAFPMTFPQLASYIWLQQAFLVLFFAWTYDNDIFLLITGGNIACELCRPADLYAMWFSKCAATRASGALLRCFPVLIVASLLPKPYSLTFALSPYAWAAFILSLILASMIVIAFQLLIYTLAFYTMSPNGLRVIFANIGMFFSGSIIPLPFFPKSLQTAFAFLPFAYMQNTPLQIYNGYIAGPDILTNILIQILWLAVLVAGGRAFMSHTLRRVVVQGG